MPIENRIAIGPEGLKAELEKLLDQAQKDPTLAVTPQIITYRNGEQKALVKVDLASIIPHVFYSDAFGRPAPFNLRNLIADFLLSRKKEGEKERLKEEATDPEIQKQQLLDEFYHDVSLQISVEEQYAFLKGGDWRLVEKPLTLERARQDLHHRLPSGVQKFGLFGQSALASDVSQVNEKIPNAPPPPSTSFKK